MLVVGGDWLSHHTTIHVPEYVCVRQGRILSKALGVRFNIRAPAVCVWPFFMYETVCMICKCQWKWHANRSSEEVLCCVTIKDIHNWEASRKQTREGQTNLEFYQVPEQTAFAFHVNLKRKRHRHLTCFCCSSLNIKLISDNTKTQWNLKK